MKQVGLFEAKTHLSRLIELVQSGEEITITRHGRPVARIVPAAPARPSKQQIEQTIERLRKIRSRVSMKGLSIEELIAEGRRY